MLLNNPTNRAKATVAVKRVTTRVDKGLLVFLHLFQDFGTLLLHSAPAVSSSHGCIAASHHENTLGTDSLHSMPSASLMGNTGRASYQQ